jgi:hypothetical protein
MWYALSFAVGLAVGVWVNSWATRKSGEMYRRWYLLCRNALEDIAYNDADEATYRRAMQTLNYIGPRTSKREPWEDDDQDKISSWLDR